jgi:hypothetical protein
MGVSQRICHLQAAANRRLSRVLDLFEKSGRRHEGVANRLDLFQPVLCRNLLEKREQGSKPCHYLLRFLATTVKREIDNVAKQDESGDWSHISFSGNYPLPTLLVSRSNLRVRALEKEPLAQRTGVAAGLSPGGNPG